MKTHKNKSYVESFVGKTHVVISPSGHGAILIRSGNKVIELLVDVACIRELEGNVKSSN